MQIEIPLPFENRYHSIFACPVSKEQSTDQNPPMMMGCGHVITKDSLQKLSKPGGYVAIFPETHEVTDSSVGSQSCEVPVLPCGVASEHGSPCTFLASSLLCRRPFHVALGLYHHHCALCTIILAHHDHTSPAVLLSHFIVKVCLNPRRRQAHPHQRPKIC